MLNSHEIAISPSFLFPSSLPVGKVLAPSTGFICFQKLPTRQSEDTATLHFPLFHSLPQEAGLGFARFWTFICLFSYVFIQFIHSFIMIFFCFCFCFWVAAAVDVDVGVGVDLDVDVDSTVRSPGWWHFPLFFPFI